MTRFVRPASSAGVVEPRALEPAAPSPGRRRLARFLGAAGMLALTGVLFWLLSDPSFRVSRQDVRIVGLHLADEAAVRERLAGLERSPNVFRVRPSEIVSELRSLPEIESAVASVTLPGEVVVHVDERDPIFAWSDGRRTWLVDREGMLFAALDDPDAAGSTAPEAVPSPGFDVAVPRVEDERLRAEPLVAGVSLPAMDFAVMRRLLSLTPDQLGVPGETLRLRVDPYEGYVLGSDSGWRAVFGHYTPELRPVDVIPRQVQCLTWLLASEARRLETAYLSVSEQGCGTLSEIGRPRGEAGD